MEKQNSSLKDQPEAEEKQITEGVIGRYQENWQEKLPCWYFFAKIEAHGTIYNSKSMDYLVDYFMDFALERSGFVEISQK